MHQSTAVPVFSSRVEILVAALLLAGCTGTEQPNDPYTDKQFAKHFSAGDFKMAEYELQSGADIDASVGSERMTALLSASRVGWIEGVQFLVDHDADVDVADAEGRTALMWAVSVGCLGTARILLDAGADPELAASDGTTVSSMVDGWQEVPVCPKADQQATPTQWLEELARLGSKP